MTTTPLPSAAEANRALRAFAAEHRAWSAADLAELDRLRALWQEAVHHELVKAA